MDTIYGCQDRIQYIQVKIQIIVELTRLSSDLIGLGSENCNNKVILSSESRIMMIQKQGLSL
jgi:hypothetical protein